MPFTNKVSMDCFKMSSQQLVVPLIECDELLFFVLASTVYGLITQSAYLSINSEKE